MSRTKSPLKHDTNPPHSIVPFADHKKYHEANPAEETSIESMLEEHNENLNKKQVEETPKEKTEEESTFGFNIPSVPGNFFAPPTVKEKNLKEAMEPYVNGKKENGQPYTKQELAKISKRIEVAIDDALNFDFNFEPMPMSSSFGTYEIDEGSGMLLEKKPIDNNVKVSNFKYHGKEYTEEQVSAILKTKDIETSDYLTEEEKDRYEAVRFWYKNGFSNPKNREEPEVEDFEDADIELSTYDIEKNSYYLNAPVYEMDFINDPSNSMGGAIKDMKYTQSVSDAGGEYKVFGEDYVQGKSYLGRIPSGGQHNITEIDGIGYAYTGFLTGDVYWYTEFLADGSPNPKYGENINSGYLNPGNTEDIAKFKRQKFRYEWDQQYKKIISEGIYSEDTKESILSGDKGSPESILQRETNVSTGNGTYLVDVDDLDDMLEYSPSQDIDQEFAFSGEKYENDGITFTDNYKKFRNNLESLDANTTNNIFEQTDDIDYHFDDYTTDFANNKDNELVKVMLETQAELTSKSKEKLDPIEKELAEEIYGELQSVYEWNAEEEKYILGEDYDESKHGWMENGLSVEEIEKQYLDELQKRFGLNETVALVTKQNLEVYQKTIDHAYKTFKPEYKLLDKPTITFLDKKLESVGYNQLSVKQKKDVMDNLWTGVESHLEKNGFDKEEIKLRKHEYYMMMFERGLAYEQTGKLDEFGNPVKSMSIFALKDLAKDMGEDGKLQQEYDRLKKYYKDNLNTPGYRETVGTYPISIKTGPGWDDEELMKKMSLTIRMMDDILDAPEKIDGTWVENFAEGFSSKDWYEYTPFISGIVSTFDALEVKNAAERLEKGNATAQDKLLLNLYTLKQTTEERTKRLGGDWNGYNMGGIMGDMLPYVGEFVLTGGAFTEARAATEIVGRKILERSLKKYVKNGTTMLVTNPAKMKIADGTIKTVSWFVGTGAQAAVNPQHYMKSTFENMTPQMTFALSSEADGLIEWLDNNPDLPLEEFTANQKIEFGTEIVGPGMNTFQAALRAYGTTWAEFSTERLGEFLPGISKWGINKLPQGTQDMVKRISLGHWMKKMGFNKAEAMNHFITHRMSYHGVFAEVFEETVNQPLSNWIMGVPVTDGFTENVFKRDENGNVLYDENNRPITEKKFDPSFFIEMGGGMTVSSALFAGGGYVFKGNSKSGYFINDIRYDTYAEWKEEVERLDREGLLSNAEKKYVIEIENDFVAEDFVRGILDKEENKDKNNTVKDSKSEIEDKVTASEVEIIDEANLDSEKKEELEEIENELEQLNEEKNEVDQNENTPEEVKEKKKEINKKITDVQTKKNNILDPVKERIETKKRKDLYTERNEKILRMLEKAGHDISMYNSTTGVEHLENMEIDMKRQRGELGMLLREEREKLKPSKKTVKKIQTQINLINQELSNISQTFNEKTGQLEISSGAKAVMESHGYMSLDGNNIYINQEASLSKEGGNINVAAHEFLHKLLLNTLKKNPATQLAVGKALHKYIMKINPRTVRNSDFRRRLMEYTTNRKKLSQAIIKFNTAVKKGNVKQIAKAEKELEALETKFNPMQAEEVLTLFSDAVYYGDLKFNENLFTKIGDVLRRVLRRAGVKAKWASGRDVYNYLRDYNKNIESGKEDATFIRELKEGIEIKGDLAREIPTEKEGFVQRITEDLLEIINPETGKLYTKEEAREKVLEEYEGISDVMMFSKPGSTFNVVLDSGVEIATGVKGFSELSKEEQAETWRGVSEYERLLIGNDLGPLWRKWIGKRADDKYENNPGWEDNRKEFLDRITVGIQPEDNGLPFIVNTWNPLESKLTTYIINNLPLRIPHTASKISGFSQITTDTSGAKEIKAPQDVILTRKVTDKILTPLLTNFTFTKEQIKTLRSSVARIVGTKLPALDAAMSKNKSISPLIAEIKKQLYSKNGPIHKIVYELMGKDKQAVETFLKTPVYKKAIINALSTTWLAKHLPMAVQKKVIGEPGDGYTTDFKGRKKGTKRGDIEAWKSSEEGPYKGMTDGKQKIRRNPNAMNDVTSAMILSSFVKGQTMTEVKRAGLENISLAITQELGLEVFKADMINDGPLKALFVGRQELFDRILDGNFVEEFVRQADRGITMFSKPAPVTSKIQFSMNEELAKKINKQASYKDIVEIAAMNSKEKLEFIDINTESGRNDYLQFFTEVLVPIFPKEVLLAMSGTFARGDSALEKAYKAKFIWQKKKDFSYFLDQLEEQGIRFGINVTAKQEIDMTNAVTRIYYGSNSKNNQKAKVSDIETKKSKKRGFKLIWKTIQKEIQDNEQTIPGFAVMLSSSSQFQGHFMRTGAGVNFYNLLIGSSREINREEHTSPITAVGKFLFINAVAGNLFTGKVNTYDNVMKSYFQGALPLFMDSRLKKKGPDGKMLYNYSDMPPLEHLADIFNGDVSVWARYFHPNVNNNFDISIDDAATMSEKDFKKYIKIGGIDPNVIVLENGQTIAEFFGVNVDKKLLTPQVIAAQQDLIYRIAIGEKISKAKISATIKAASITASALEVNSAHTFSKAINNARVINHNTPSRGMSAWDFDDTLATTKSGVRATIPNPDGTPQPGRKVIFLAGGAGSGKSNVVSKLGLEKQGFKIVNSDISLEWLKKNSGLPANMNDLTREQLSELGKLQYQSRQISKGKMMEYQGNGDGVVVDGTGGSINAMTGLVNEFKAKGYDVSMVFVETSLETALERNNTRKERSLTDKIVTKNHEAVQGNKDGFKEMFGERFMEVKTDNLTQEDAMPTSLTNKMNDFVSGYKKVRLDAEQFATQGTEILEQGGEFDFSEFNVVTEGAQGPMFNTAMKRAKKFGTRDTYVLTARPQAADIPIQQFLASQGLNIPLENITGLGNSTGEAKAEWILEKYSEGYNNIFFADDAMQNVEAVKNVLDQLDIKSDVIQAKIQFSKSIDYTSGKLFTNPAIADIKETSSINDVKSVDRLSSPGVYSNIQFSKKHRGEYENLISKHRPDLVKEGLVSGTVDNMFNYIDNLNVPSDKKRKYERITTKWIATSNIKLDEDSYKIKDAVELSEKYKEDIFSYNNPNEIIEKYAGKTKAKPINPKDVKEFAEGTVTNEKHGITEYVVDETKEGQEAVRKVIDTHWGENSNPWCITQKKGGKLTEEAWDNWTGYSKGPKSIIFQNGKLLAFKANSLYWDRMDNDTKQPVVSVKEGRITKKVELTKNERVKEVITTSEDGNTITTEYKTETNQYGKGTKLIEERVNGKKVKTSEVSGNGTVNEVVIFGKDGKATASYNYDFGGNLEGVNRRAGTFELEYREDVASKVGDFLSRETFDYDTRMYEFSGTINLDAHGIKRGRYNPPTTEIGWRMPESSADMKNLIKIVDGKVRINLEKVLEVDPEAKGIPSEKGYTPVTYMFSKGARSTEFNEILERATKVEANKTFSEAQARIRGGKKKFRGIIPASAQDFMGLIYNFIPRGKKGEAAMDFFKRSLVDPFARGIDELNTSRQTSANDYKNLTKQFPKVKKRLNKKAGETNFTNDQAVRVYLWNKAGFDIPGLSKRDLAALDAHVKNDSELQAFADALGLMSKKAEGYSRPGEYWLVENIASDLMSDGAIGDARSEFLAEWQQNADQIFSEENLNKIEAIYGSKFREALVDSLYRMRTGKNRPSGGSRLMNNYMNWVNNSVGAIMFFNIRSAVLQTISATNYINWSDNNPLKAAAAFANQKQFWSDFVMLFNSDYLKQRRAGNRRGVNEADLTSAVKGVGPAEQAKAVIRYLLKIGFLPTQIADSFAIASGGASFYRNRVKTYLKQGMSKADAEAKAFLDFQERTEVSQQSARPDMISQQQANPLGRLILAFQNTPMQYARIMNKAARDLANNRGDAKHNISKIMYYGFIQSVIFGALQSALFAVLGDDDEEEFDTKKERIINQMIDSWFTGIGYGGKAITTIKNTIMEYMKQEDKGYMADHTYTILKLLGFSPPIGSKARKIYSAIQTKKFNEGVSEKRGLTLDNPTWSVIGNVIEGITNIPLGRISQKMLNLDNAMDPTNEWWKRVALVFGWNTWDLGVEDKDIETVKEVLKEEKKVETKKKQKIKKEEKKIEKEKEEEKIIESNIEKQKQEKKEGKKKIMCAAVSKSGKRCKTVIEKGSVYCTIHIEVEQGTKEVQCKKVKKNKKRCGMMTKAKSGYCYYHD